MNPLISGSARSRILVMFAVIAMVAFAWSQKPANAANEEAKLSDTQAKIDKANNKKGVLSEEIAGLSSQIDAYETQVAALRAEERDAEIRLEAKQEELDAAEAEVKKANRELKVLAKRLKRSLEVLKERLVSIYQSGGTDMAELILTSNDYGDLIQRSEYLEHIQDHDAVIVDRVRGLRDEQQAIVVRLKKAKDTIESSRNEIASEEQNLATARGAVESQQGELKTVRAERAAAVDTIDSRVGELEDIESDLQAKIQEQIAAASGLTTLPAGPLSSPSAAGLIWPVSGTITSGFGSRYSPGGIGTTYHEGIDLGVPEGTPIRAAASGTVILASYNGGYGNYTCIDHGSGLSTCYAHQSQFGVTSGQSVDQGQVIGYSGNTGSSTGPHLHFEVRINGVAVDPLGYL